MKHKPSLVRPHPCDPLGTQKIYRFPNGYGASIVRFYGSYQYAQGLWELAIIRFHGPDVDSFSLTYDTPITGDVIGYLSDDDVEGYLDEISRLT